MSTMFDLEVTKIRDAAETISSGMNLVGNTTFDLTTYDLKQSEKSLREAADRIAMIRTRLEGF